MKTGVMLTNAVANNAFSFALHRAHTAKRATKTETRHDMVRLTQKDEVKEAVRKEMVGAVLGLEGPAGKEVLDQASGRLLLLGLLLVHQALQLSYVVVCVVIVVMIMRVVMGVVMSVVVVVRMRVRVRMGVRVGRPAPVRMGMGMLGVRRHKEAERDHHRHEDRRGDRSRPTPLRRSVHLGLCDFNF
jgi:predicted component of type VI protein secretion system